MEAEGEPPQPAQPDAQLTEVDDSQTSKPQKAEKKAPAVKKKRPPKPKATKAAPCKRTMDMCRMAFLKWLRPLWSAQPKWRLPPDLCLRMLRSRQRSLPASKKAKKKKSTDPPAAAAVESSGAAEVVKPEASKVADASKGMAVQMPKTKATKAKAERKLPTAKGSSGLTAGKKRKADDGIDDGAEPPASARKPKKPRDPAVAAAGLPPGWSPVLHEAQSGAYYTFKCESTGAIVRSKASAWRLHNSSSATGAAADDAANAAHPSGEGEYSEAAAFSKDGGGRSTPLLVSSASSTCSGFSKASAPRHRAPNSPKGAEQSAPQSSSL